MNDHEYQKHHCSKMIEHLEIAKSYCDMMYGYTKEPENAILADVEPHNIENLIEGAKRQLDSIGQVWSSLMAKIS